jgi:MoaA/NifB/PqqE/SkfB family radical SAM enzyme
MIVNFYFIEIDRPLEIIFDELAAAAEQGCDSIELGSAPALDFGHGLGRGRRSGGPTSAPYTDPITHIHIADIIQRAVELGTRRIMFRTDLHIPLSKQDIHDLYYLGVFFFRVPLFGHDEQTHSSIFPISTPLETTLAGIERLRTMHIPKVGQPPFIIIEVPVYQKNAEYLLKTIQLAVSLHIDTVSLRLADDAVRYTDTLEIIDSVFDTAIGAKTWIEINGPPVCVREERRFFFRDYYTECSGRNHMTKLESCAQCLFDETCSGISETYLKVQGEAEFAPITAIK